MFTLNDIAEQALAPDNRVCHGPGGATLSPNAFAAEGDVIPALDGGK